MSKLRFFTTVESKAKDHSIIPVEDGRFLILTDMRKLTYDFGGQRLELGDVVELDTEAQRQKLLTPLNKFYYIKETNALWRYDGEWVRYADEKMVQEHIGKSIASAEGIHGLRFNQETKALEVYDGEQDKFVPVTSDKNGSEAINCQLKANGWKDGRQTVAVPGLKQIQNGVLGIPNDATAEQRKAIFAAGFRLENQRDGALDIVCDGRIPPIDVTAVLILLHGGSGSKTTYITLSKDKWVERSQTVVVGGISPETNGMINAPVNLTPEQAEAMADCELAVTAQGMESMTITYRGKQPNIDLPVMIIAFD